MNEKFKNLDKTDRQNNFDLLRIISTFAVVLIHANATIANDYNISLLGYNIQSFVNVITRFSVPCFVMLSGAFILSNTKNADYKRFYAKSFYKIGIPLIIFSVVTIGISEITAIIGHSNIFDPFISLLMGDFSNYWFMFMLIGLYFLSPIIIRIKNSVSNKSFCIGAFVWLIVACISQSTSSYKVSYSFGVIFSFLGFFLIGNVIYENFRNINLVFSVAFLSFSIGILISVFVIRNQMEISLYLANQYTSWFSPLIIIASILLFIGFANIKININLSKLSSATFLIYLFHTKVYLAIIAVIKRFLPQIARNTIVFTLSVAILAFLVSLVLSIIYLKIWNILERKLKWKEKWNKKCKV